jgi:phosphoribosylglycinamide formyltransferase-1
MKKRILVFASGDKIGGGSGFQEMVERSRTKPAILDAEIVAVVCNYEHGGVWERAHQLEVPFIYFPGPYTAETYQKIFEESKADYVMCSGWKKKVFGLKENLTINIHPGPLPRFGGKGMYGRNVHEAVIKAYRRGEIQQSAVCIHFVNPDYDKGAGIVQIPVTIRHNDSAETLAERVLKVEHIYQSIILNEIVHRRIILNKLGNVLFENEELFRFAFTNE